MNNKRKTKCPLISIIIVVFNGEKFIQNAIDSVVNQDYEEIELIVIDGRSTDSTVEIIKKNLSHIKFFVSEPDAGIYDAMNKAVKYSSGEWVYFLGSDDALYSKTIVSSFFVDNYEEIKYKKLVFGNVKYGSLNVKSKFNKKLLLHNSLHHQSVFYKKTNFDSFKYNSSLKLISDYELNLALYLSGADYFYLNKTVASCHDQGASRVLVNFGLFLKETNIIRKKHLLFPFSTFMKYLFLIKAYTYYVIRYF